VREVDAAAGWVRVPPRLLTGGTRALRERFSKEDAAKAEQAAHKAEKVVKRRDLTAHAQREELDSGRHSRGGGGSS